MNVLNTLPKMPRLSIMEDIMNKQYTITIEAEVNIGGSDGDFKQNVVVCTGDYTTGDLASIIDCADKVTEQAEEAFKHIRVPVYGIYCIFTRDDGTVIDRCNINEFEDAKDFIQKYFIV